MSFAKVSWRCEKDHKCEASWNYCAFCGEPYTPPEPELAPCWCGKQPVEKEYHSHFAVVCYDEEQHCHKYASAKTKAEAIAWWNAGTPKAKDEGDEVEVDYCPECEGDGKARCSNPDHSGSDGPAMGSRIGCPVCGHSEDHILDEPCENCNGTGTVPEAKEHEGEYNMDLVRDSFELCSTCGYRWPNNKPAPSTCPAGCGSKAINTTSRYYKPICPDDITAQPHTPKAKDLPAAPPYTKEDIDEAKSDTPD